MLDNNFTIGVVIPCYKVSKHISKVIAAIPDYVDYIILVDDCCPERSGDIAREIIQDPRLKVIKHDTNQGVGGATKSGYKEALKLEVDIVVKLDGDEQMDPSLIQRLVDPIICGHADYSKGNRFFDLEVFKTMPIFRVLGNLILTFITKISSGYYRVFDPTNGFTAISKSMLEQIRLDKIDSRYFFESDMLFRLKLAGAKVKDVPIKAIYGDEESNLKISLAVVEFTFKHLRNFLKRLFYFYFLRDFSFASLELIFGFFLFVFGIIHGMLSFINSNQNQVPTPIGSLILTSMSVLCGLQLLLAFFSYDMRED